MYDIYRLNDPNGDLRNSFAHAVTMLRAPAGPKYQTVEDCLKDRKEFKRAFHRGLFLFHLQTIDHILFVEDRLKDLPKVLTQEDKLAKKTWEILRQIFRTFNDCIPWMIFKEPSFTISRLCRNRSRGFLKDQNAESVLRIITDLSRDGDTLAIWNDATKSIDLQDVTAISSHGITFYELKEGRVNEEISEIVEMNDPTTIEGALDDFLFRRGPSGLAQFERFVNQQMNSEKLYALVTNDNTEDPFTKIRRTAIYPSKKLEHYDQLELVEVLREVREREFACISVDNCLHILAINQNRRESGLSIDELVNRELKPRVISPNSDQADCRDVLIDLQYTLHSPISMPVMLRPLEVLDIADICIGNVLLFFIFDINAWSKLFRGCRLSWSSVKEGRREKSKPFLRRQMVVDSRIPIIKSLSGDGEVRLGDKILSFLVSEGIRPASMAEQYDVLVNSSEDKKG